MLECKINQCLQDEEHVADSWNTTMHWPVPRFCSELLTSIDWIFTCTKNSTLTWRTMEIRTQVSCTYGTKLVLFSSISYHQASIHSRHALFLFVLVHHTLTAFSFFVNIMLLRCILSLDLFCRLWQISWRALTGFVDSVAEKTGI